MTDKVQKIKEWISKQQDGLMDVNGNFEYLEHEGAYHILCNLDTYIDSMQEEPVRKVWHYANEHPEIEKPILLRKVNGVVELAICHDENFYPEIGEIWAYIEDLLNLSNVERTVKNLKEPVSEDLEEAMQHNAPNNIGIDDLLYWRNGFITGAKWQKAKDESTTEDLGDYINKLSKQFPEVSFAKLSRIAVRVAKWKEQQLMANAVEGVVHHFEKCGVASVHYNDPTGVPMAYFTSPEGLSAGDKVKIIVIKED